MISSPLVIIEGAYMADRRTAAPSEQQLGMTHMVDPATERREFQAQSEVNSGTDRRADRESPEDWQRAQLQQAQRLENLGQLAGGIAPDFNHLFAVILSSASFVSAELAV